MYHALSDRDVAVLASEGDCRVEGFGQVFYVSIGRLEEILGSTMVVLNVAHDCAVIGGRISGRPRDT